MPRRSSVTMGPRSAWGSVANVVHASASATAARATRVTRAREVAD